LCSALCPDARVVYPCVCEDNTVYCHDITTELDLKALFDKINANISSEQKRWRAFNLEATQVRELPANVFGDITFEDINLINNPHLEYIHPLAFMRSSFTLKKFNAERTPLSNAGDKERDIFDALSRCPDLEMIRLSHTNLTSIPDKAFHPINGEFTKLGYIMTEFNPIKTIGEFAFYYMPNLYRLVMTDNKFTQIKRNTFTIRDHSDKKSEIYLQGVPLTDTSFDPLSLIRIRRPVSIRLFENHLTTLYESVFAPFLEANQQNYFDLSGNKIECDCRIKWILDDKDYYYFTKIAGTDLWDCKLTNC